MLDRRLRHGPVRCRALARRRHLFPDLRWFGREEADLYLYDLRHDPTDRAHLDRVVVDPHAPPDPRLRIRLLAEPGFDEATLVVNHGRRATGHPLARLAEGGRHDVWETEVEAGDGPLRYSFALRRAGGAPVYLSPAGVTNAIERLDRFEVEPDTIARFSVPRWARGAVIYQIFPDRFRNGDPTNDPPGTVAWGTTPDWLTFQGGDLDGIVEKLDHLVALGVDVLYLNPVFVSPSTHRYDAVDFHHVDPSLGGDDALRRLVDAVHDAGLRVVLDGSFNHCHPRFFAFADVVARGDASPYRHWFRVLDLPLRVIYRPARIRALFPDPERYLRYLRAIPETTGIPLEERHDDGPPVEPTYEAWYGVPTMPRIDLSNPDARAYFLEVAAYWLREFDIDGWRMDVARYVDFDVWPDLRTVCKAVDPDAFLFAEIMGDAARWLQGDTFDGTMNYVFRHLCVAYLAEATMETADFVEGIERMLARWAPQAVDVSQNLLSSHDTERFLHAAGGDRARLRAATIVQMTMPGAPGIYYGDEIGMTGDHDERRRAFPWDEDEWDREQLELTRSLIAVRKAHPALRLGRFRRVHVGSESLAFLRETDEEAVLVLVTRAAPSGTVVVDVPSEAPELLWGRGRVTSVPGGVEIADVPAWSGLIVRL